MRASAVTRKKDHVEEPPLPGSTPETNANRFFNRELSWLEFNRSVLEEAFADGLPVLERLKFLSIFSSNLDEFYMIRVSGLMEQIEEGVGELSPDGMSAADQLAEIGKRLRPMLKKQSSFLHQNVMPALGTAGVTIEPYSELPAKEQKRLDRYFRDNLFPILTPQSVDSSHPFPYVSNVSLNLGLFIEPDRSHTRKDLKHLFKQKRFTRIKLPSSVQRLIRIEPKENRFALLEDVVAANVGELFPNMKVGKAYLFRVTRDADIEIREDEAGDLMRTLERELQRRRARFPVRLEVSADMPEKMVKTLTEGIGLTENELVKIDGFVDIPDLMQLYSLDLSQLKEKPYPAIYPAVFHERQNHFEVLKKHDVVLHHPYTSYSVVSEFVAQAAEDPDVQAIKICLYRTGKDSPVVDSLMRASQLGKQVTALIELKARFDEENNIEWARKLENEGVHVVYGISSLKTHSKVMLVIRREKGKLVRYVHLATGNYNPTTSRVYTDIGLMTSNEEFGSDVTNLFNFLTGYSQQTKYQRLLVAPVNLRERFISFIRREKRHAEAGRGGRIIAKFNSLTDVEIIDELYVASQAGVQIDLIIRGICMLRPGVSGLSENIRVRSIVGRFLEHSRVFYFANSGKERSEEIYIGSSDWMSRNLDRRVEVAFPILDAEIKAFLKDTLLKSYLADNVNARILSHDGGYHRADKGKEHIDAQASFVGLDLST